MTPEEWKKKAFSEVVKWMMELEQRIWALECQVKLLKEKSKKEG